MRATLRLPRSLFNAMVTDLTRSHAVAYERVGFLQARFVRPTEGHALLLPYAFHPVDDEHYVDSRAAACINATAIRSAMQRALDEQCAVLHVHLHEHAGAPGFSTVDLRTLRELTPSFHQVVEDVAHGGVVLSHDSARALVWMPGAERPVSPVTNVVGFPLSLVRGLHVG